MRYLPLPPDPELVEAQTSAEYLRRRVAEERRDVERRVEEADERITRLQAEGEGAARETARRQRARTGQARSALAKRLFELAERHIFSSGALAEAYGHMELATELAGGAGTDRAVTAYSEARAISRRRWRGSTKPSPRWARATRPSMRAMPGSRSRRRRASSRATRCSRAASASSPRTVSSRRATSRPRFPSYARLRRASAPRSMRGAGSSRRGARCPRPSARPSGRVPKRSASRALRASARSARGEGLPPVSASDRPT